MGAVSARASSTKPRRISSGRSTSVPTRRSPLTWARCCGRRATATSARTSGSRSSRRARQRRAAGNGQPARALSRTRRGIAYAALARVSSRLPRCAALPRTPEPRRRRRRGACRAVRDRGSAVGAARQRRASPASFVWSHDGARDRMLGCRRRSARRSRSSPATPPGVRVVRIRRPRSRRRRLGRAHRAQRWVFRCRSAGSSAWLRGLPRPDAPDMLERDDAGRPLRPASGRLGDRLRVRRCGGRRAPRASTLRHSRAASRSRCAIVVDRCAVTMRLVVPAPAKVNLFLHVMGRRADGYHTLESLFALIDWADTLTLAARDDGTIVRATPVPASSSATISRCARRTRCSAATGSAPGVDDRRRQAIPIGAGLGGGSSDAASVLLALNRLWRLGLPRSELAAHRRAPGRRRAVLHRRRERARARRRRRADAGVAAAAVDRARRPAGRTSPPRTIFAAPNLTRTTPSAKIDVFSEGYGRNDLAGRRCREISRRGARDRGFAAARRRRG